MIDEGHVACNDSVEMQHLVLNTLNFTLPCLFGYVSDSNCGIIFGGSQSYLIGLKPVLPKHAICKKIIL